MIVHRENRFDKSDNLIREIRLDISQNSISSIEVTSQGFLKIPATLTRVGVLEYQRADGSTVRELRPPEEVLKAESLATLKGAPVTEDHRGMINPSNVSEFQTGAVGETITSNDFLVDGVLTIQRADTIRAVQSKKLRELSPGYTCRIDKTPGDWNGERYDQIQRDIVYNHVALGPKGWGRSGPEVSLRMDAAVSGVENKQPEIKGEETIKMKKITFRLDGVTYTLEVPEGLADTLSASLEHIEQERADAKDAAAKAEGAIDAAAKEVAELQEKFDAAISPEAIENAVNARIAVIERAKELSPEIKCDGLSLSEIRKEALVASGFVRETLDSKEDAYVEGAFESAKAPKTSGPKARPGVSPEPRDDAKDKEVRVDAEASRTKMMERNRNAYLPKEA